MNNYDLRPPHPKFGRGSEAEILDVDQSAFMDKINFKFKELQ